MYSLRCGQKFSNTREEKEHASYVKAETTQTSIVLLNVKLITKISIEEKWLSPNGDSISCFFLNIVRQCVSTCKLLFFDKIKCALNSEI